MNPLRLAEAVKYHAVTAFLFTKSDIKTTLIPITVFAVVAAPLHSLSHLPHVVFWIWLHLLQFDVSNQTLDPEEDKQNKRDRPLPAGRVTLRQAVVLRWLLVPTCFAWSLLYSVQTLYASICLVALTIVYDELHAHAAHYAIRNAVNAGGFAAFEAGATLVAGGDRARLDGIAVLAIALSAGIFATTIHTQDFKDVAGDARIGRRTVPLVHPAHARPSVLVGLLAWSLALGAIWQLDALSGAAFVALAGLVGARFLCLTSVREDQVSFYLYNVWLSCAHALPGYYRFLV